MGNKSGNVTSSDFNMREWVIADRQNSQNQTKGNYRVLQNSRTSELIDQYELLWPGQEDFRFYLDSYNWRKQEYNIVQSRFIVQQHNQKFCSKTYAAKVYIEHIQTRLSDVTDIPFPDNLYAALAILEGYQKLYQNIHHYFPISQDQICIDKDGFVKVWVNSDLSKNCPQTDLSVANYEHKDEAHMVQELLSLIWQNTDEQSEPTSFKQFFIKKKGKKRIGFDQAKVIVNEYAKHTSCQIPQKFISILQMNEHSQEYQDTKHEIQHESHQGQQNYDENYQRDQNNQPISYYEKDGFQYTHQGGYMQGEAQGGYDQQGAQGEFIQEDSHEVDPRNYNLNSQSSNTFYHPQQHPQQGHEVIYHQMPVASHQYNVFPLPQPHALNQQFIPRILDAPSGPIISIPPARSHFNHIPSIPMVNPMVNHMAYNPTAVKYQVSRSNTGSFNDQNWRPNSQPRNDGYLFQGFNNQHQQFQQRISTLTGNQMDENSQDQHQQIQDAVQYQGNKKIDSSNLRQSAKQQQNENLINRSLQLLKQSQKKISETQKLRVNKSHINSSNTNNNVGNVAINYPLGLNNNEELYSNSRHTPSGGRSGGNSRHYEQQVNQIRQSQNNNIREQYHEIMESNRNSRNFEFDDGMLCTKYYTLETQVELDQQIAADLKKFIMAA